MRIFLIFLSFSSLMSFGQGPKLVLDIKEKILAESPGHKQNLWEFQIDKQYAQGVIKIESEKTQGYLLIITW